MADLTDIQAAQSVKIVGSDATGLEQTPVNSTTLGELQTSDIITGAGLEGALSVGISAIEAKVGISALTNRKVLTIYNNSNHLIYWGRTSSLLVSTGTPIKSDGFMVFEFSPTAPLYLISAFTGCDVRITESI